MKKIDQFFEQVDMKFEEEKAQELILKQKR